MKLFRVGLQGEEANSGGKFGRIGLVLGFVCNLTLASAAHGQQEKYHLSITSGTLGEKLSELANTTDHQLIFPSEKLNQPSAARLDGREMI